VYRIDVISIFPYIFTSFLENSILKRAQLKNKITFCVHNLRDYSKDKHKMVDDVSYGGGPGMVLKPEPIFEAISHIKKECKNIKNKKIVLLSPQGKIFTQQKAKSFSKDIEQLVLICGRYEGVDERVLTLIDEEISIGDYVLSGGEIPALVLIESIARLIPGVLGKEESFVQDSFYEKHLDYSHYTRPLVYKGLCVPDVLTSGDHKKIEDWRKKQSLINTYKKRPDLLSKSEIEYIKKVLL
jgi:tRNA (guanine37-N1)-methyltransferase